MSKEYIEKDAAIALAKDIVVGTYHHRCIDPQDIQELPSADVKPIVHAKWHDCYELIDGTFVGTCSACGKIKKSFYPVMDNYCAECGAIMDADMRGNVKCPKEE